MSISPSHVAVLVPSVRKAADLLARFGFQIGEAQEWEGEGTLEIYVEIDRVNSLLLMEAVKPGAYQRAMEKRGPGIHHLAIDVPQIENYLESLSGTGWLLHPMSIHTLKHIKTAYLARPGFPGLIEVKENQDTKSDKPFVNTIELQMDPSLTSLLKPVGLDAIVQPSSKESRLKLADQWILLRDLF